MNKLPVNYGSRTNEFLCEARTVKISLIVRIITGILCFVAGAIVLNLSFEIWDWRIERYIAYVISGLWAVAGLYMFITFAVFIGNPEQNLIWINQNDKKSAALARPVDTNGKRIVIVTKLKKNYQYEFKVKRAVENYKAFILVLLGFYFSVVAVQILDEKVSIPFLITYPLISLLAIWMTLIPGSEINVAALFRLKYMLYMALLPSCIYILYDITEDKKMAITMCVGSFLMPGIMIFAKRLNKPRRKYTFPTSIKERKVEKKVNTEPEQ